jgi:TolB protein
VIRLRRYALPFLAVVLAACSQTAHKPKEYKIALVADASGQHGMFVINSDRTGGKLLTPDPTAQLRPSSWSPDGKKIAFFSARPEDAQILRKYRMPLHFPLYLIDAVGGSQKRIFDFPVSSFEWSPDGRQLLYVSAYEDPAHDDADVLKGVKAPMSLVYLMDFQTGEKKRVTDFGQNCYGSWSPDGHRLALSFGDAQHTDIYIASIDGKRSRKVSDSTGINIKPVWSPDGKKIAYVSFVSQPSGMVADAYVIDSEGKSKTQIRDADPYEIQWSIDGKLLLLKSYNGYTLATADGNKTSDMKNKVIKPQDPAFTPDGDGVMFRSDHEGPWYLYFVDLKGENIRRISGNLSSSTYCFSPVVR